MLTTLGFYRFRSLTSRFVLVADEALSIKNCAVHVYEVPCEDYSFEETDEVPQGIVCRGELAFAFERQLRVYWPVIRRTESSKTLQLFLHYPKNLDGVLNVLKASSDLWAQRFQNVTRDTLCTTIADVFNEAQLLPTNSYTFYFPIPFYLYRLIAHCSGEFLLGYDHVKAIACTEEKMKILDLLAYGLHTGVADVDTYVSSLPLEFIWHYHAKTAQTIEQLLLYDIEHPVAAKSVAHEFLVAQHTNG